jgi:hypothetical protein
VVGAAGVDGVSAGFSVEPQATMEVAIAAASSRAITRLFIVVFLLKGEHKKGVICFTVTKYRYCLAYYT